MHRCGHTPGAACASFHLLREDAADDVHAVGWGWRSVGLRAPPGQPDGAATRGTSRWILVARRRNLPPYSYHVCLCRQSQLCRARRDHRQLPVLASCQERAQLLRRGVCPRGARLLARVRPRVLHPRRDGDGVPRGTHHPVQVRSHGSSVCVRTREARATHVRRRPPVRGSRGQGWCPPAPRRRRPECSEGHRRHPLRTTNRVPSSDDCNP
mmetsp:Transcript_32040/g.80594  ORF Transcript_32040/g.80594 Transcript_32040/m.80594 type:complete len:211 (-) Transcript_32040:374-1006(-)